ncbi:hypothetical protein GGI43DRAFT_379888 [Trichoderma evansii]
MNVLPLDDLSDRAVRRITKILYMDATNFWDDESEKWLRKQKTKIKELTNPELLRPESTFSRAAMKLSTRHQKATLCSVHDKLDPRVIRSLLWHIAYESTAETNQYRVLRIKGKLEVNLERHSSITGEELELVEKHEEDLNCKLNEWLDWTNEISALWLGERQYRKLCRSTKKGFLPDCVETKCEACMLATVGGCTSYLTALRASLLARQAYKKKSKDKEVPPPPLLRVIDSWISRTESETKESINSYSEGLVDLLVEMRKLARRLEDEQIGRRKRRGVAPLPAWGGPGMVTWTKDGLPEPLQDRQRKRPAQKNTWNWTVEEVQTSKGTIFEDSGSMMMRGGIQTDVEFSDEEDENEEQLLDGNGYDETDGKDVIKFEDKGKGIDEIGGRAMLTLEEAAIDERSSVRDSHNSRDSTQESRRIDVKSTNTLVSLYDCYRALPEPHNLSNSQTPGSVSPLTVDTQESTSSWTSGVVDDDTDIYDDDRRPAEKHVTFCGVNDATESADNENHETELATPAQDDGGAPPAASSVYSCDEPNKDSNRTDGDDNKNVVDSAATTTMAVPFLDESATSATANPFDVGLKPLSHYERESAVPAPLDCMDVEVDEIKEVKEQDEKEDEENMRKEKLRNEALAKLEGRRDLGKEDEQAKSEISATLEDNRKDKEQESEGLAKSEGSNKPASCFESMGWGAPKE